MSLEFVKAEFLVGHSKVITIDGTVQKGERVAILGASGCGKSTLLRNIAGLETFKSGEIRLNDKTITNLMPQDRDIGFVFQHGALFPHLNVIENVCFGLHHNKRFQDLSLDLKLKRAFEFLSRVGLSDFSERSVLTLSGGEKQRVALVRTLVVEPKLLLLDEPLSALDQATRLDLQSWLIDIFSNSKQPVLLVTHDVNEAQKLGTRIIEWKLENTCINIS